MNNQKPSCDHGTLTPGCGKCLAFKRQWDRKVEKSGISNIEQEDGYLKVWASSVATRDIRNGRIEAMRSREEYYRAAGHFLWDYKFKTDLDRNIWEMHASGISTRDIATTLSIKRKGRNAITKIIHDLAKIMGVQCRK